MTKSTPNALPRHKVVLYFDVCCPWSRIALTVLRRYVKPWNLELDLQPVSLQYLTEHTDTNDPSVWGFGKISWLQNDLLRASEFYNVTLNLLNDFPDVYLKTTDAQMVLRKVKVVKPAQLDMVVDAFFDAFWTTNLNLELWKVIENILIATDFLPEDKEATTTAEAFVSWATNKENTEAFEADHEAMVDAGGVFDIPWIVVTRKSDGETTEFHGSDRMEMIAAFLQEKYRGPLADGTVPAL